jgi:hypothetical protein
VRQTYLSFQTRDRMQAADWSETGRLLLRRLGNALEALGFAIDYEAGREESDWLFVASRNGMSITVVLSLLAFEPCRWFTWLEGEGFKPLDSPAICGEVHPGMQAAVESHPGVSHVRWHDDHTTLQGV